MWKDKLVSYDGQAITYDQEGHPLSYLGSSMTWDVHNRLSSITGTTPNGTAESITYTYLSDGSRRSKTVDGVTTTYHYNNGLLLSQTTGDETIRFYYDSTGKVVSIGYQKGTAAEVGYFFARNAQGDIIAVYRSSDSKLIGTYEYDLWGKPVSTTEASAGIDTDGILSKNPLRYRGYYFDNETGFYYLQSRYYDPGVRRFVSADSYMSTGQGLTGHNMFAYCLNNPICCVDSQGAAAEVIAPLTYTTIAGGTNAWNPVGWALLGAVAVTGVICIGVGIYEESKNSRGSAETVALPKGQISDYRIEKYASDESDEAEEKAKVVTERLPGATKIYRWGGTNPGNLTPRTKDKNGLSFSLMPKKGAAVTTIDAVNSTGILCAIPDGGVHVSICPTNATMEAWIAAGSDSPWTKALKSIVTKY